MPGTPDASQVSAPSAAGSMLTSADQPVNRENIVAHPTEPSTCPVRENQAQLSDLIAAAYDRLKRPELPMTKSEEEYQLALHEKLLEARKDATDFINNYMIMGYLVAGLVLLIVSGYVLKFSAVGAEVNLGGTYLMEYIVVALTLAYVLLDFHILRLSKIFHALRRSGSKLRALNVQAKVVTIEDMHFFVSGIAGVILALARRQTRELLDLISSLSNHQIVAFVISLQWDKPTNVRGMFRKMAKGVRLFWIEFESFNKLVIRCLIRILVATFLLYLPMIVVTIMLMTGSHGTLVKPLSEAIIDYAIIAVVVAVFLYTIYAGFNLGVGYSSDLVSEFINRVLPYREILIRLQGIDAEHISDEQEAELRDYVSRVQAGLRKLWDEWI
jgi:hypothetical protein